jgi:hypothetical protein
MEHHVKMEFSDKFNRDETRFSKPTVCSSLEQLEACRLHVHRNSKEGGPTMDMRSKTIANTLVLYSTVEFLRCVSDL